jgi:hypothetical protein
VTAKGIAIGSVNAVVFAKKDARAMRRNADGSTRAKMTDVGHSAPARRKEAPLAVPVAAVAVNVTVAHQTAALPHLWVPSRSRSASARPAAGTFMHQAMNSIRPCRRNKPVRIALGCVCRLVLILQPRAIQPSWCESHTDSTYFGCPRPSAANACAHIWHGYGSEP